MQIRNAEIYNKTVSSKGSREILRTIADPDSLAATILLESSVTGGRGINAYKRGGIPEFRERFTDDVVSAVFWMKGVDIFNKIGNTFGERVLKLPVSEFDVGKDALRTPFNNIVNDLTKNITDEKAAKSLEKKLAAFKFGKIVTSTLLATTFVGFILPKINQQITKMMMSKSSKNKKISKTMNDILIENNSFESFDKKIKSPISFKGLSSSLMATTAHYLENNKICKMLSCDVGILTGRVKTARNADEGREYFFRDASSSFFYFGSTPLVYSLLQKLTKSKNITNIDPVASKQITNNLITQLNESGSMSVSEFAIKTLGKIDESAKNIIEQLPFNSDVISLEELKKYVKDENIIKKAFEMSKLQPQQSSTGRILTKQQVYDVFKNGSLNTPEFMKEIYEKRFGQDLTNPYKFISMKKITSFRDNIDKYVEGVIDYANRKNGGVVDKKIIEKISKKSFLMSAGFRAVAIMFSATILGIVIPKIQYYITAKKTGSNKAPGLRDYENNE